MLRSILCSHKLCVPGYSVNYVFLVQLRVPDRLRVTNMFNYVFFVQLRVPKPFNYVFPFADYLCVLSNKFNKVLSNNVKSFYEKKYHIGFPASLSWLIFANSLNLDTWIWIFFKTWSNNYILIFFRRKENIILKHDMQVRCIFYNTLKL